MSVTVTVNLDLRGLIAFQSVTTRDLRGAGNGPIRRALRHWGRRYRSFVQRRFVTFSRGGGDWAPLKSERKRGDTSKAAILRDTSTVFAALDPEFTGNPGALQKDVPYGVVVGYGGPGGHPGGGATVADIARIHNAGLGRVPERKIIVPPDRRTVTMMVSDMRRGMQEVVRNQRG